MAIWRQTSLRNPAFWVGIVNSLLLLMLLSHTISDFSAFKAVAYEEAVPSDHALAQLEDWELHTRADAEALVGDLGSQPAVVELAQALSTIDGWIASDDEQSELQAYKIEQLDALRTSICREMSDLHREALEAADGTTAARLYSQAGQLLGMYPVDLTHDTTTEVQALTSQHAEVRVRIETLRRQRYNLWALTEIQKTIQAIDDNASSFRTSDNVRTVELTVQHLAAIDPSLLEPVTAQLYAFALEKANGAIKVPEQLELAGRLIDPTIRRKGLGDF